MKITKVWLDESTAKCFSCRLCETLVPQVFEVTDKMIVKQDADFKLYENEDIYAIENCPILVIKYEATN